jgi:subtilase family serine protease
MRRLHFGIGIFALPAVVAAILLGACNAGTATDPLANVPGASRVDGYSIPQWQAQNLAHRACPQAGPGEVQCELLILNKSPRDKEPGWGARDIEAAYNLPSSSKGSGEIVAIVDAYDNPNVASDLAVYRRHYGLPKAKFYKYNQDGQQSHYPESCTGQDGWCSEIDIDVEMVSASCPNCTIYLVEANSFDGANFGKAEAEAVKLGAHIVSNSLTCGTMTCPPTTFDTPGVTYLAAAGDNGYGLGAPAGFATVVAVGGTILSKSGSIYNEVVWPDTGGGCAPHFAKPSWQHDPSCTGRTANDVAAVAWNVAEYDTYGEAGWFDVSGTSIATPIVAGAFALAGNADKQDGGKIFWTLSKKKVQQDLHVISSGNNGCPPRLRGSYLCTAGTDEFGTYSGSTGWGTPNGIGAF